MTEPTAGEIGGGTAPSAGAGDGPAFSEPKHVGRPNIGDSEFFLELAAGVLERGWLTNDGPLVRRFEAEIADYLDVRNCVAMCNGTIALEAAIRAVGLSGEVIVPSFTFVATAHALHWQGITPVFADIDRETHTLDTSAVRRAISPRTTGILGVHLWGRAANVEALEEIAEEYGLALIFDAAHAFGCSYQGRLVGGFGNAEVLSFHATKFFNTFEGGAVVTNDDELAEKLRIMRNFGFCGYDNVVHAGINGKMTEICAAMGLTNLRSLDSVIAMNRRNYQLYAEELRGLPGLELVDYNPEEHNNFQYVVLIVGEESTATRDDLVNVLHENNVLARKYFWPGCHNMSPYRELFPRASQSLAVTEGIAEQVLVLPTGSTMSVQDIKTVCAIIRGRLAEGSCG